MIPSRRALGSMAVTALGVVLALAAARTGGARSWQLVMSHSAIHVWLLLWLGFVSLPFRSIGTGGIAKAWLAGFFPVAMVAVAIGGALDSSNGAVRAGIVPLLEEALKGAVVVVAILAVRRRGHGLLLSDAMVLGCAVGAGFALREDMARDRIAADGFQADPWHVFFPTTLEIDGAMLLTHALWSLLVGLGVGLVLLRRGPLRGIGAVLCVVAVTDHAAANTLGDGGIAATLTADGTLSAVVVVSAITGALVLDRQLVRAFGALDDRYRRPTLTELLAVRSWTRAAGIFEFRRLRNTGLAAAAHRVGDPKAASPAPSLVHKLDRLNARRAVPSRT